MLITKSSGAVCFAAMVLLSTSAVLAADPHDHNHHQHVPTAQTGDDHSQHQPPPIAAPAQKVALKMPDTVLIDQDGRRQRLVSDVMADKVIVANFVYTNCTTVCPLASTLFSQTQDKLGELLDSQVRLLSLSVDPARDTPARLKSFSRSHNAGPGWFWLTGPVSDVTAALKSFGTYTANYQEHPVVIMIGDAQSGLWTRYYGFPDPERLVAAVRDVLAARNAAARNKE